MSVLKEGDELSRERAAFVFGLLEKSAAPTVPDLARQLREDKSAKVRSSIARSLGLIGPSAKAAIPALEEAATNDVPELATAAKTALVFIRGPSSK
jgi:HEAT repeat protein